MKVMVIYDVSSGKERGKIAELCLDFGLERTQKSVFIGEINKKLRAQLVKEIRERLPEKDFNLQIFEIDKTAAERRLLFQTRKKGRSSS